MTQTVLRYGKASQQRIAPYIVISKRKLSTNAQGEKLVTSYVHNPKKTELNKKEAPKVPLFT